MRQVTCSDCGGHLEGTPIIDITNCVCDNPSKNKTILISERFDENELKEFTKAAMQGLIIYNKTMSELREASKATGESEDSLLSRAAVRIAKATLEQLEKELNKE